MDIWTDFSATNINMSELNKSDLQQNIIIKSEELEKNGEYKILIKIINF